MGSLCTRSHEGAHRLLWNVPTSSSDKLIRELVDQSSVHAPDATDAELALVWAIVRRARQGRRERAVELNDREYEVVRAVVASAAEYMISNGYADDTDSPEVARQARALGDGRIALVCWTGVQ